MTRHRRPDPAGSRSPLPDPGSRFGTLFYATLAALLGSLIWEGLQHIHIHITIT